VAAKLALSAFLSVAYSRVYQLVRREGGRGRVKEREKSVAEGQKSRIQRPREDEAF
jgi:hypothetical protein